VVLEVEMTSKVLRYLAGLALWVLVLPMGSGAWAQDEGTDSLIPLDVSLGFRGVGEVWQDEAIIVHYRSSRFAGTGFASVGVLPWLLGEFEIGYMRQAANTENSNVAAGALELVPVTVSAHARKILPNGEIYGGVGYAMAVFTETTSVQTVSGTKPGMELRGGVRIHTDFVQPSMWTGASGGIKRMDVELMFARRKHQAFGVGSGFDFSAWRLGIGLVARL
jgi:hypothetical protein